MKALALVMQLRMNPVQHLPDILVSVPDPRTWERGSGTETTDIYAECSNINLLLHCSANISIWVQYSHDDVIGYNLFLYFEIVISYYIVVCV